MYQRSNNPTMDQDGRLDGVTGPIASQSKQNREEKPLLPSLPFLYNLHILPCALPGIVFVITMSGELLLSIVTVGCLIIYLLLNGGAHRNAVIAYICAFVAAQMCVLYSCLPLIWISLLNIPLMMLLNMFLALTAGWGLIQFRFFISDQPILARTIELGLFTLYPVVSLGLVTWLTAYLVTVRFAVYVAIFYGFLLLRSFLKPMLSSFHQLQPQQTTSKQILGTTEAGAVLFVYLGLPCGVYFITHLLVFLQGNLLSVIELILVALLPVFLSTFIQLRGIYEQCNITVKQVHIARTVLGLVVLVLSCWVLHQSRVSAATAWLLPAILCYTLLGFSMSRNKQLGVVSISLALSAVIVTTYAVFEVLPITVTIPMTSSYLTILILLANLTSSVACVLLSQSSKSRAYLSPCLVIHSVILVHTECYLLPRGLYSNPLAILTSCIAAYVLSRLHSVAKVSQQCLWLACSIHAMKLPFIIQFALRQTASDLPFRFLSCYSSGAMAVIVLKVLVFEDRVDLQPKQVIGYSLSAGGSLLAFLLNVARPTLQLLFGHVGLLFVFLSDVFLTSLLSCKLTLCNMQQYPHSVKASGVAVFLSGFGLLVQAPVVKEYVSPWLLLMVEVAVVLHVMAACSLIKVPHPRLYALVGGALIGIPLGVTCCDVFSPNATRMMYLMYTLLTVTMLTLVFLLWRYSIEWRTRNLVLCTKDGFMHGLSTILILFSLTLLIPHISSLTNSTPLWTTPSIICVCSIYGVLSISFRIFCVKWQQQDPFSYKPGLLPTYGNAVTMAAYLFAVLGNPIQFPEIWNSVASVILLCLQNDSKMLPKFTAAMRTSIIFGVCSTQLAFFTLKHSLLWTKGLSVFAILEMLVLPLSVPPLVVMTTVLSRPLHYTMSEHTIIWTAPLPFIIFIFGNSYTSWLLAGVSFVSGMWLLQQTSFGMKV